MNFNNLPIKMQLILYLRASYAADPKARFATSDPEYHRAAGELIAEGLLYEFDSPGGSDRAYGLTEAGKRKYLH